MVNKPKHFLDEYRKEFEPFFDKKIRLLEIGIESGDSLKLWKNWFTKAEIIGVDIKDKRELNTDRIKTIQCDQTDKIILEEAPFDIIIDDGGHKMSEQINSFKMLYPILNKGGIYVIEDLNTSYWEEFIDQKKTTEFLKGLIDDVNKDAILSDRCQDKVKNVYEIYSLKFYKYLCIISKS